MSSLAQETSITLTWIICNNTHPRRIYYKVSRYTSEHKMHFFHKFTKIYHIENACKYLLQDRLTIILQYFGNLDVKMPHFYHYSNDISNNLLSFFSFSHQSVHYRWIFKEHWKRGKAGPLVLDLHQNSVIEPKFR